MDRRSLLALGAGLIVGEPARRAYSFLNGFGFDRAAFLMDARARMTAYIQGELKRSLKPFVGSNNRAELVAVQEFLLGLGVAEPPIVTKVRYDKAGKRLICSMQVRPIFIP